MITYIEGDLFESAGTILVNPCNTQGISGAGLSKVFKEKYPKSIRAYGKACHDGLLVLGVPLLTPLENNVRVLHFPTKDYWRNPSKIKSIQHGLARMIYKAGLDYPDGASDHYVFPMLGCGLGHLDWAEVKPLMEDYLTRFLEIHCLGATVSICIPKKE